MTTIQQVKKIIQDKRPLLDRNGITEIGIFGSYRRGEERPDSDVDILIDISRPAKMDLFDLLNLKPGISQSILSEVEYI